MKNMETIITYFLLIIIIIGFILIKPYYNEYKSMKKTQKYYNSEYLIKQGSTSIYNKSNGFINYDLRSWDGGKNWYVVNYNFKTNELKIIGDAETIYPGLINHLKSWDNLTNYVFKNGPINPNDSIGVKFLKNVGFTIVKK